MTNNPETTQSHYETQQQAEMRESMARATQEATLNKTVDVQRAMAIIAARPVSEDSPWQDSALCSAKEAVDPEIFDENTKNFEQVKRLCGACSVQEQCLEYALSRNEQYLLWGGKTKDEFNSLKRRRARARRRGF